MTIPNTTSLDPGTYIFLCFEFEFPPGNLEEDEIPIVDLCTPYATNGWNLI